jgi:hypothetical protein
MNTTFETPVTYRIEFEFHGGTAHHYHTYYSLATAIRWYEYFKCKLRGEYVTSLIAYKGDIELQRIDVDQLYDN